MKKIVVIGPESTGKSTITEALAAHFGTSFAAEFAREYVEQLNRPYRYEDLWEIAKGQIAEEERAWAAARNGIMFCDTDLNVLKVWSEHKYQKCDYRILQAIAARDYDFYFLTDIDLPWVPDPQREHPAPEMRQYFFEIYREIVIYSGKPWVCLSGHKEQRLQVAVQELERRFSLLR